MDVDTDDTAAPSSLERVLRYFESGVLDRDLSILGRALLINSVTHNIEEVNEAVAPLLLAFSPLGLAHVATKRSSESEPEWEHVGILAVELRRSWLLFETHVAHCYLDLFHERDVPMLSENMGRVNVSELERCMWTECTRATSTPVLTVTGLLEALPDGLSQQSFLCEEPPCRQRFVDVTVSATLLQIAMVVQPGWERDHYMQFGRAVILSLFVVGFVLAPFVLGFVIIRGVSFGAELLLLWMFLQSFVFNKVYPWVLNYWSPPPVEHSKWLKNVQSVD